MLAILVLVGFKLSLCSQINQLTLEMVISYFSTIDIINQICARIGQKGI